ncbi:cupin domain-containing protein [Kribbella sandramycini]|uniref:ChrR-like cupin domain-containing protein n=1 Tax=Kribbella sandramycini TaxID=60450 RepID=A0A841SEB9_9ACTN|nr:hypothetical protein [Kribbella sandramycini]
MKEEREFFPTGDIAWEVVEGIEQRVLSIDNADGTLTRLARWPAGTTSGVDVIQHDYVEEVYLFEGELTDLTLEQTFHPGDYACRPPGMPHGPYTTVNGCLMLEIRYSAR